MAVPVYVWIVLPLAVLVALILCCALIACYQKYRREHLVEDGLQDDGTYRVTIARMAVPVYVWIVLPLAVLVALILCCALIACYQKYRREHLVEDGLQDDGTYRVTIDDEIFMFRPPPPPYFAGEVELPPSYYSEKRDDIHFPVQHFCVHVFPPPYEEVNMTFSAPYALIPPPLYQEIDPNIRQGETRQILRPDDVVASTERAEGIDHVCGDTGG